MATNRILKKISTPDRTMPFFAIVVILLIPYNVVSNEWGIVEYLFNKAIVADPNTYDTFQMQIVARGTSALEFLTEYQDKAESWYERGIANALIFKIVSLNDYKRYQVEFDKWSCGNYVPGWFDNPSEYSWDKSILISKGEKTVSFLIEKLLFDPTLKIRDQTVTGWHWSRPKETAVVFLQHIEGKDAARAIAICVINGLGFGENGLRRSYLFFNNKEISGQQFYVQSKLSDDELIDQMILFLKTDGSEPLAAWVLGEFADPRAIGPLIESLNNYSSDKCQFSAMALAKIGEPAMLPCMSAMVTTESAEKRSWLRGVLALSQMDDVVRQIQNESLRNGTPLTRQEALVSMAILGGEDEVRKSLREVWPGSTTDERAISLLISSLKMYDVGVGLPLADILAEAGESAIPELLEALSSPRPETRSWADFALTKMGRISVQPLVKVLYKGPSIADYHAVRALRFIGDKDSVPALILALNNPNLIVVGEAARALGEIGDPNAIEPLLKALENPGNWNEKGASIFGITGALAQFKEQRAFNRLAQLAQHQSWLIRRAAIEALPDVGRERSLPVLFELIKHEHESTRGDAAIALGKLRDPKAVPALINALSDSETFVSSWAAWSLGEIGDARALPYLRKMASETKGDLKRIANEAIDKIEH